MLVGMDEKDIDVDLVPARPSTELAEQITNKLATQHPLHGLMGRVLDRVGGEEYVVAWAERNPTQFMRLLMQCVPTEQTNKVTAVQVNIDHESLRRGPLDQ